MSEINKNPRPMARSGAREVAHFNSKETPQRGNTSPADIQAREIILTAVPRGTSWCVKLIDSNGNPSRLGRFPCRADALRTATRLAEKIGARAVA